ncbi:hypothetical protein HHK36_032574 [Tetracentron sinense]|uniref:Uncharacterized protein n=1 Tax=Tetracentron sinense TaxID=13715 RepID=A0A834Y5A5_TETSI|nr:hypothetical protein HHK36_032574 [Tetracentron sinense]
MEGIIPIVYKALKRNKTRRNYESLSSGAAQSFNVAYWTPPPEKMAMAAGFGGESNGNGHRRRKSVGERFFSSEKTISIEGPRFSREVVGFRSQRLFSCIKL